MTVTDVTNIVQAGSAVAIVLFSVLSYRTAKRALAESRRQADAAAEALTETRSQATISREAVEAANAATVEARRETQFAHIPFVRLGRPALGLDPTGQGYFEIIADNLGPGPALELRLSVERQDRPDSTWFRDLRGTPMMALLADHTSSSMQYSAADLRDLNADWEEGMRSVGTGNPPRVQPVVAVRLRMTLTYQSVLGGQVSQVYVWETDRIHLPPDPWTWRLETITLDPGRDNGSPITVRRPD